MDKEKLKELMAEKPDLTRAVWLLERMTARHRPITDHQVYHFGVHPDGPTLPEQCLVAVRLPDDYGTTVSRLFSLESTEAVIDLSVTPAGEPCVVTVIDSTNVVLCGKRYDLEQDKEGWKAVVKIIGFSPDALPVTNMEGDVSEPYDVGPYAVFKGGERILENEGGIFAPALLKGGSVVYMSRTDPQGEGWSVWRDREVLASVTDRYFKQFFESSDGEIFCVWRAEGHADRYYAGRLFDPKPLKMVCAACRFVHAKCGVCIVEGRSLLHYVPEQRRFCRIGDGVYIGENAYVDHFTELPDGRIAYVGSASRDHLRCWVVAGEEQPGFELVSSLFQRAGTWCYYGALGRYLYTMRIP